MSGLRLCLSGLGGLFVAGGWTQSETTGVSQADFSGSHSRHSFLRASGVLGDTADKFLLLQSWHPVGGKGGGGQLGLSLPCLLGSALSPQCWWFEVSCGGSICTTVINTCYKSGL